MGIVGKCQSLPRSQKAERMLNAQACTTRMKREYELAQARAEDLRKAKKEQAARSKLSQKSAMEHYQSMVRIADRMSSAREQSGNPNVHQDELVGAACETSNAFNAMHQEAAKLTTAASAYSEETKRVVSKAQAWERATEEEVEAALDILKDKYKVTAEAWERPSAEEVEAALDILMPPPEWLSRPL